MNNHEVKAILENNQDIMNILIIIDSLGLNDSWLCAGTIRNFIWNYLNGRERIDRLTDVDVIFFDKAVSYEETQLIEQKLKQTYPDYVWELKNQVYMHQHNPNTPPYQSATDAISKFPETCTALGIRLNHSHKIELFAPYGIEDLLSFNVYPTPYYLKDTERIHYYNQRVLQKNWSKKWPNLTISLL